MTIARLQLLEDQAALVEAFATRKSRTTILETLAQAWPLVPAQLGDRWPAFVDAALAHGQQHGVQALPDAALHASLWCVWGARFAEKPGFEWAAQTLQSRGTPSGLKVRQLFDRSRAELQLRLKQSAGTTGQRWVDPEQFDRASQLVVQASLKAGLDTVYLTEEGENSALNPLDRPLCDLQQLKVRAADALDLKAYVLERQGPDHRPVPLVAPHDVLFSDTLEGPKRVAVLAHETATANNARLIIQVDMAHTCELGTHPTLTMTRDGTQRDWRGKSALRRVIPLPAGSTPGPSGLTPVLGGVRPPDQRWVEVSACGVRPVGQPVTKSQLQCAVYSAQQTLWTVEHRSAASAHWPAPVGAQTGPALVRVDWAKDGQVQGSAPAWQQAWIGLNEAFAAAIERLGIHWQQCLERHGAVE